MPGVPPEWSSADYFDEDDRPTSFASASEAVDYARGVLLRCGDGPEVRAWLQKYAGTDDLDTADREFFRDQLALAGVHLDI